MTDDTTPEEFAPIAAAMKRLPYFAPSPHFADRVMARVHVAPGAQVPAIVKAAPVSYPARRPIVVAEPARPAAHPAHYFPRSIPARIAAVALLGSLTVTMSLVALISMFQIDLLVLVARVFGEGAIGFLAALGADAAATATTSAAGSAAAAGTVTGAAVIGSFAAGLIAATAGLRAAASASRRAA